MPGRNTSEMTYTAGSRRLPNCGIHTGVSVLCKGVLQAQWPAGQSQKSLRQAAAPRNVSPGDACFLPSCPDDGQGGRVAFARDNRGPTDEGRKEATDGCKESVNDGSRTRDMGLASCWPAMLPARRRQPRM
jgi:hypothetical protein